MGWGVGGRCPSKPTATTRAGRSRLDFVVHIFDHTTDNSSPPPKKKSRIITRPTDRVRRCLKYHGSGRVGSGRVRRFCDLAGRDGLP